MYSEVIKGFYNTRSSINQIRTNPLWTPCILTPVVLMKINKFTIQTVLILVSNSLLVG